MKVLNTAIAAAAVALVSAYSAPSQAAVASRISINHAATACQGMDASDRSTLLNQAQGTSNTGVGIVSVVCGGVSTPVNNGSGTGDIVLYEMQLHNATDNDILVDCILTDGFPDLDDGEISTLYPKQVLVPAHGVEWISWNGLDTGGSQWDNGAKFSYPSSACQLPQGTSINYTVTFSWADVGL